jgi:hypothetical protein
MQGFLYPERPVYRVVLDVTTPQPADHAALQHRWRGKVSIRAAGKRRQRSLRKRPPVFSGSGVLAIIR